MKQNSINISNIEATLFDLDGVVINSEDISHQVFTEMAQGFGFLFEKKDHAAIIGTDEFFWSTYLADRWKPKVSASMIVAMFWKQFFKEKENACVLMPGFLSLVTLFKNRGITIGLVTNSPRNQVDRILEKLSIRKYFDDIITIDDCSKGKPDKEPYIKAQDAIGIYGKKVLVIEDSDTGVESGLSAGCSVVGVPTKHSGKKMLKNAHWNYKNLTELESIIQNV